MVRMRCRIFYGAIVGITSFTYPFLQVLCRIQLWKGTMTRTVKLVNLQQNVDLYDTYGKMSIELARLLLQLHDKNALHILRLTELETLVISFLETKRNVDNLLSRYESNMTHRTCYLSWRDAQRSRDQNEVKCFKKLTSSWFWAMN